MADQAAEGLLSPFLRGQRFKAVEPFLRGRVLDIGSGSGGLAQYVPRERYVGLEIDEVSIGIANRSFPSHQFYNNLPENIEKFDTVVALAVIEHAQDPLDFLLWLKGHLSPNSSSMIVVTTPHPQVDWVHTLGAKVGLFSRHASDEHEDLLDKQRLWDIGNACGLSLAYYNRFLCGANQIAAYIKGEHQ